MKRFDWDVCDGDALFYENGAVIDYDDVVELLNELYEEKEQLKAQLKSIEDDFEISYTEKLGHFDKDKLYVKDNHTTIHLNGKKLFIEIYIPQIDEFYRFKYTITGKSLMRELIENYNPKGMTDKRFELMSDDEVIIDNCSIVDDGGKQTYWIVEYGQRVKVVELLNELHKENELLKMQLQNTSAQRDEFHRGARENANYVGELKQENEQLKQQIADWETSFDLLKHKNEQLKKQLLYDGDDVCGICKHEYLVPSGDYFIGKCKKRHKECSKEDIKYCENFELRQVDFDDLIRRMDKELYK